MRIFLHQKLMYKNIDDWSFPHKISNSSNEWSDLIYEGTNFVAIARNGIVLKSSDTKTWSNGGYIGRDAIWKLATGVLDSDNCIVALGAGTSISPQTPTYYTSCSYDGGLVWDEISYRNFGTPFEPFTLAYGDNKFIAVIYDQSQNRWRVYYATRYNSWHHIDPDNNNLNGKWWTGLIYFANKFALVDSEGYMSVCNSINIGTLKSSWSQPFKINNLGISNTSKSLCTNGTKMFSVSLNGYWSETSDGENWTKEQRSPHLDDNYWVACACNNNKIVALNKDGYISTKRI